MLEFNERAIKNGLSAIPLRIKSKAPANDNWSELSRFTYAELTKNWRKGQNIGARPGKWSKLINDQYVHVLDIDVDSDHPDDIKELHSTMDDFLPGWRDFPMVQSGSGGQARHLYFVADRAYTSRNIAKSKTTVTVKGKKRPAWSIDLYGTGKQVVIPPSIHPDTGREYKWLKEMDWSRIEAGLDSKYTVDARDIERWGAQEADKRDDRRGSDEDEFEHAVRTAPLGIDEKEAWADLKLLPEEWEDDYHKWIEVGQIIHHEFEGSQEGLELWHDFSKDSDKYDADALDEKWESFHDDKHKPKTWRTIKQHANEIRRERARDEIPDEESEGQDEKSTGREWKDRLDITEDGAFKSTVNNIATILLNDARLRGVIRRNVFSNKLALRKDFNVNIEGIPVVKCRDEINGTEVADSEIALVRLFLETSRRRKGYGMSNVPERNLKDGMEIAADSAGFHPVREYLEGLEWDGKKRLDYVFVDYLGTDDNEYTREASALFFLGGVTRIFEPGHKFDFVPIIRGAQGKRKSTFLSVLAVNINWYAGLTISSDPKVTAMGMAGKWLLELPELAGFSRHEVSGLKNFVSTPRDNYRAPWGRTNRDYPRQCVMAGTTNDAQYLRDDTGNRRYWPVDATVKTIDTDKLETERDQLWAEAVERYQSMRKKQPRGILPLYIKSERALELANIEQAKVSEEGVSHDWAEELRSWLDAPVVDRSGFEDLDSGPHQRNRFTLRMAWTDALEKHIVELRPDQKKILQAAVNELVRGGEWELLALDRKHRIAGYNGTHRRVYSRVGYEPERGNPNFKKQHRQLI